MFIHKTPAAVKWLYPQLTWSLPSAEKVIYLTFDDGPIPDLTEFILQTLQEYNAKATFFCVGANLTKYPEIAQKAIEAGHILGNHTFNHLNGWQSSKEEYLINVKNCEVQLEALEQKQKLFRPPYGKISRQQIKNLNVEYKIIMWDVLSGDYSKVVTPENCLKNTVRATQKGSIVLFHENVKAGVNMKYTLPRYLKYFSEKGYVFKVLP